LFQGHASVLGCKPPANGFEGQEIFPIAVANNKITGAQFDLLPGHNLIYIPDIVRQDVIVPGQSFRRHARLEVEI
jgi:hypothetical protein